jgi:hypothetical protein
VAISPDIVMESLHALTPFLYRGFRDNSFIFRIMARTGLGLLGARPGPGTARPLLRHLRSRCAASPPGVGLGYLRYRSGQTAP